MSKISQNKLLIIILSTPLKWPKKINKIFTNLNYPAVSKTSPIVNVVFNKLLSVFHLKSHGLAHQYQNPVFLFSFFEKKTE